MAIAKAFSKLNVCTLNTILTVALFTLQHLRLFVKKKKKIFAGVTSTECRELFLHFKERARAE